MNINAAPAPMRRTRRSAARVGMVALAAAIGALAPPAVSHAEKIWDIGVYDRSVYAADMRYADGQTDSAGFTDEMAFCCIMSGGELSGSGLTAKCEAPPATAQSAPQAPWEAGRAPRPETATPGQVAPPPAPAPGPVVGTYNPRLQWLDPQP